MPAFSNSISEFSARLLGFNCALEARCNSPPAQPPRRPPWYIEPKAGGASLPNPEPNGFANAPLNEGAPELAGATVPVAPALGVVFVVEIALLDLPVDGATPGAAVGAADTEGAAIVAAGAEAAAAGADGFAGSAAGAAAAGAAGVGVATTTAGAAGAGAGAGASGKSTTISAATGLGISLGETLGVS